MKKYLISCFLSSIIGILYVNGFYIVAICILSLLNILYNYIIIVKGGKVKDSFDILNSSGLCFIGIVVISGLIRNRLSIMEAVITCWFGLGLLSIWIVLILVIEYLIYIGVNKT